MDQQDNIEIAPTDAPLAEAEIADAVRVAQEARAEADELRRQLAELNAVVEKMAGRDRSAAGPFSDIAALYRYVPGQQDVVCMLLVCYGYTDQEIADALDITLDVFRTWRRRFASFRRAYERGRMRITSSILRRVAQDALKGKFAQAQFLLERADARYQQHVHQHVDGSLGGIMGGVPDAEIEQRIREVHARIADEARDAG